MSKIKSKNPSISVLRVVGMILVLLCHTINYYEFVPGSSFLPQVFSVGVNVFFMISGFLYGRKTITDFKSFIIERWKKLCLPAIIISSIYIILLYILNVKVNLVTILMYMFNFQGLYFVTGYVNSILNYSFNEIGSLGPLWFISVIMVCYCLIPVFQKIRKSIDNKGLSHKIYSLIIVVLLLVFSVLSIKGYANITYFIVFYLGYILGSLNFSEKNLKISGYIMCSIITVAFQILRIYIRKVADGTSLYLTFVGFSQLILGVYLFISIFFLYKILPNVVEKCSKNKFVIWLDKKSMYIYMTHGLFCMSGYTNFNIYTNVDNIFISTILFVIFTLLSAVALNILTDFFNNLFFRKNKLSKHLQ